MLIGFRETSPSPPRTAVNRGRSGDLRPEALSEHLAVLRTVAKRRPLQRLAIRSPLGAGITLSSPLESLIGPALATL